MQFLIFNGNPNGMIMCELSNWNGRLYKVSRNELIEFSERYDCENTGLYFLFGIDDNLNETLYIGEAENLFSRLKQHLKDPTYWNECVVVISKDDVLNKAHIKYLENTFYNLAKQSGRSFVVNGTVPTKSSLSEYDQSMIQEFIDNARLLVSTLGFKSFDVLKSNSEAQSENEVFLINAARNASGRGIIAPEGFAVLKGSRISDGTTKSFSSSLEKLRQNLISKEVIDSNGIFVQDYVFTSPSLAAATIMGRNANGRTEWKTAAGLTLDEIEKRTTSID